MEEGELGQRCVSFPSRSWEWCCRQSADRSAWPRRSAAAFRIRCCFARCCTRATPLSRTVPTSPQRMHRASGASLHCPDHQGRRRPPRAHTRAPPVVGRRRSTTKGGGRRTGAPRRPPSTAKDGQGRHDPRPAGLHLRHPRVPQPRVRGAARRQGARQDPRQVRRRGRQQRPRRRHRRRRRRRPCRHRQGARADAVRPPQVCVEAVIYSHARLRGVLRPPAGVRPRRGAALRGEAGWLHGVLDPHERGE